MKTLIEMFTQDIIWRRQLVEVNKLRKDLYKVVNLTKTINDNIIHEQLSKVATVTIQRLQVARFKLEMSEKRILETYNKLVNDPCDYYSAHFDDEYFIEKIDLDGYLRGTIL